MHKNDFKNNEYIIIEEIGDNNATQKNVSGSIISFKWLPKSNIGVKVPEPRKIPVIIKNKGSFFNTTPELSFNKSKK